VVERGESTLAALAREVKEETGLALTKIKYPAYAVHIEDRRSTGKSGSSPF